MEEIRRRSEQRREGKDQYLRALQTGDMAQARKYAEASTVLRRDMVSDAKELLDAMGIPWVDAPSEGEAQASTMAMEGTVNAVASQDHDSIVFGAPVLVRNVTISGKRRLPSKGIVINVVPERITLASVLSATGLTRDQLVDYAILLGTDFNPDGFEGVGPATALKYLKKYGRLEEIKELKVALQSVSYREIRDLYLNAPSTKGVQPECYPRARERLMSFHGGQNTITRERVDAARARVQSAKGAQSETLEKWFG